MIAERKSIVRLAVVDAALLTVACLIPTMSHMLAWPLYVLNPMLALLLAGILLGRDWRNSLILAVLLPAVSCLLVGMPTAGKMVCMMAELAVVATLFGLLYKQWKALPSVIVAILGGKVVYYALKAIVIAPSVLVETNWTVQLFAALLWGGLFSLLLSRNAAD